MDGSTFCVFCCHQRAHGLSGNMGWQLCPKKGWKKTLYIIVMVCTILNLFLLFPLEMGCKTYCYELT